jgi:hypothetical protein
MADLENVPALTSGETARILRRFARATNGPWAIGRDKGDPGVYIFPEANPGQPIAFVFDSVARNAKFLVNAYEDQRRLLASVLRYKAAFATLARQIRESARSDDGEGNRAFLVKVPEAILIRLEEMGMI